MTAPRHSRLRTAARAAVVSAVIAPLMISPSAASRAGDQTTATISSSTAVFRVCADPNNLPFSNDRREGFENRLAELAARSLGRTLTYTWWPQRRGFVRHTLDEGRCDVVIGIPFDDESTLNTRAYYRSTYVFVSPANRPIPRSLDDPALRRLRIGVQMVGDDFANTPPAHALSARGIIDNIIGYSVIGDYSRPNPPARIVDAVAAGDVDVAIVWGPLAGYFVNRESIRLRLTPVTPERDASGLPFTFDIAMGVRHGDRGLHDALDGFVAAHAVEISRLLDEYGVPRVTMRGRRP